MKAETILKDLRYAHSKSDKWRKEADEDYQYLMGKQWDDKDVQDLASHGIEALTINKIQPFVFLLSGIQRQNRTDFMAFPEGEEDSVSANIVTRLLKNAMKNTMGEFRVSEAFEDQIISGLGYLEPYMDYSVDPIKGEMKLAKKSPFDIYPDPASVDYDLSDARFVIKLTMDLSKDELLELYPDAEKTINKLEVGKIDFDFKEVTDIHRASPDDYYKRDSGDLDEYNEDGFDLVEYYYKKSVKKYLVIDRKLGEYKHVDDKEEAEAIQQQASMQDIRNGEYDPAKPSVTIDERYVPEIWKCALVGGKILVDEVSWTYPRWQSYPFIPFFGHRVTTAVLKCEDRAIQGIVRALKPLQREHNKRRTQELRLLNSTVNGGMFVPKKALDPKNNAKLEEYGSSPGIKIKFDPEKCGGFMPNMWRSDPAQLSSGHHVLAEQAEQDMRDVAGVNIESLAMGDKAKSGRAIMLQQRQGMVMIQRIMDNLEQAKRILGKFLLSQLAEIFTVETAIKVLGESFIKELFERPVTQMGQDPMTGEQKEMPVKDEFGEMQMEVDEEQVRAVIEQILNDAKIGKFDVAIGQGSHTETVKYTNYTMLQEMMQSGIPIPPEVILEESMISEASKAKIKEAIQAQQSMAQGAVQ